MGHRRGKAPAQFQRRRNYRGNAPRLSQPKATPWVPWRKPKRAPTVRPIGGIVGGSVCGGDGPGLQPSNILSRFFPGRCPRLGWCRAFGAGRRGGAPEQSQYLRRKGARPRSHPSPGQRPGEPYWIRRSSANGATHPVVLAMISCSTVMARAFSPQTSCRDFSRGAAPGWDGVAPLALEKRTSLRPHSSLAGQRPWSR